MSKIQLMPNMHFFIPPSHISMPSHSKCLDSLKQSFKTSRPQLTNPPNQHQFEIPHTIALLPNFIF